MDEKPCDGARTHEPNLRELTAEMDGLRNVLETKLQAIKDILKERHDLYNERDTTRSKAVETAFANSERSNQKTEQAQKDYNVQHNDLIKKMDKQNQDTMPRVECETRFKQMEEKIGLVRDSVGGILNRGEGYEKVWGWIVAAAGSGGVLAWIASHYAK